jgi:hypothetical protein
MIWTWVNKIGGPGEGNYAMLVRVDGAGNAYACGSISGTSSRTFRSPFSHKGAYRGPVEGVP